MVHIWVRSTLPWNDDAAFRAQVDPSFEPCLRVWDASFEMPYNHFRARVYDIAQANLTNVRGAKVSDWDDIPEGALVLPVDDDDWFAPHAAETLKRELRPATPAYVWEASFAETPTWMGHRLYLARRRLLPWTPPRWSCSTNSYAMEKAEGRQELLRLHTRASAWVDRAPPGAVRFLGERLSMMNRTIASQTQLRRGDPPAVATPDEMRRKLARYRRLYRRLQRSAAPWARPYLAMMGDLVDELTPR